MKLRLINAIWQTRRRGLATAACLLFCWLDLLTPIANLVHAQLPKNQSNVADQNSIEDVEPGVQLIGRPRSVRNLLDSRTFTMTPDGKMLVGARGRELCIIDWDAQELIRTVKMPFQNGSVWFHKFQYSNDGKYLVVHFAWYGRPYDQAQELELDDFHDYRSSREFPSETFQGNRVLIYNADYQLMHDIELQYEPTRDTAERMSSYDIWILDDNKRAVVIGVPHALMIDLELGDTYPVPNVTQWATKVGDRFLDFARVDGRMVGIWWDPESNRLSTDFDRILPDLFFPLRPVQAGSHFAMRVVGTDLLTIDGLDPPTEFSVGKLDLHSGDLGSTYSPDGKYFLLRTHSSITLIDLVKQETRAQIRLSNRYWQWNLFFRPQHNTVLVRCGPQVSEIAVDDDFENNLQQVANLLPESTDLHFSNKTQYLAIGTDSLLDLRNGETQHQGRRYFSHRALSPVSNLCVLETAGYLSEGRWRQIETRPLDSQDRRLLYTHLPSLTPAVLAQAFGIFDSELATEGTGVMTTHLSIAPDEELLRHVYIDNLKTLRLRLTNLKTRGLIKDLALESSILNASSTFSHDSRRVAVFSTRDAPGVLEVLDTTDGRLRHHLSLSTPIQDACLDRRGRLIAIRTHHSTVQVIDLATEEVVFRADQIDPLGFGFQFGTDQFYLATREAHEIRLRFFDRGTWEASWEHSTDYGPAYGMAIAADGTQAAFGLTNARIELWTFRDIDRNDSTREP